MKKLLSDINWSNTFGAVASLATITGAGGLAEWLGVNGNNFVAIGIMIALFAIPESLWRKLTARTLFVESIVKKLRK